MAINIAPGVYSQITDLGAFVQEVPGTIALMVGFTEKGPDNVFQLVGGRSGLIDSYGEPNMAKFTKNFGHALYNAYNFTGEPRSLYFMRALPENASYANIVCKYNSTEGALEITSIDATNRNNLRITS